MAARTTTTRKTAAGAKKASAASSSVEPKKVTFEVLESFCGLVKGERRTVTLNRSVTECEEAGYIKIL